MTATPHPALDITVQVARLERGSSQAVPPALERAGGKGVNVARVLHARGESVFAFVAAPGGDAFARDLAASGIPHRLVARAAPTRRSIALVEPDGETTVVNEQAPAMMGDEVDAFEAAVLAALDSADVLALSGSLPAGYTPPRAAALIGAARTKGVATVVDTGGEGLLAGARAGADVLKPNRDELRAALGVDDPTEGARQLIGLGARLVIVSLGSEGLLVVARDRPGTILRARLASPLQGNPTGAGDAAVAAVCALLHRHARLLDDPGDEALTLLARWAITWSAAAVLARQAGELGVDPAALDRSVVLEGIGSGP